MEIAWIGLGSNLGDRRGLLESVLAALGRLEGLGVHSVSSAWETSPVGPVTQEAFLNAVVRVSTSLSPQHLLQRLLSTERDLGRVRNQRWGPRAIDLDLLLYADRQVDEPGLRVPHEYLRQRRFVLAPLMELAPGLRHPADGRRLFDLLRDLPVGEETVVPIGPLRLSATQDLR
ncbi:MAG: 2-amino-4-hydroxy-6-hydroxymethyldihydropteridine diphosphokinase [Candidatus Latescibacterota bacterium]|nr:2-amino-4-hydroxy-6-hydroxymethyldihydropteridine diphosphokinase [Candidatus Latescibacterota bacterium]MEE3043167.1 2-amino-4-hydroxy-6-hydroxymethyldihydropteridine diphosphokinase [Candidatus Latescibacterota bacterium]